MYGGQPIQISSNLDFESEGPAPVNIGATETVKN